MTKQEKFVEFINEKLFNDIDVINLDKDVYDFWKQLSKPQIKKLTDNGKIILSFLQQAEEYFDIGLKCKEIADEIGINSRGISGSMRKLLEYGYVEKIADNPCIYRITSDGKQVDVNAEVPEEEE